ncbi:MAG: hypothetical protein CHACPFDD_02530 [Phycisphaerae bacterium]|nr:hypothetical protein [Phycisphaerae bacterium]
MVHAVNGCRQQISDAWRESLARAGLSDLSTLLSAGPPAARAVGEWERLSKPGLGGRERWRWRFPHADGRRTIYLKRYFSSPLRRQLDRIMRQSCLHGVAWTEYQQAVRLELLRVPAAAPVAVVERMRGPFEAVSAVLLAEVAGEPFDTFCQRSLHQHGGWTTPPPRHDLVRRLARFVSAFHQTGLRHRDLYLCHIFIHVQADGRPWFGLIDLARIFRPRWRRTRWTVKDLSQLDASASEVGATRADRLRFLLAYLGVQRASSRVRRLARAVVAKSSRIVRRIRRAEDRS